MAVGFGDQQPAPGDELLTAALAYAARGWYVFPLHAPTRKGGCTCGHANCTNIGKHPLTKNGLTDASIDEAQIRAWWKRWPWANVAVVTGAKSGLLAVDVDTRKGGEESFRAIQEQYGPLTNSLTSNTGSGGAHLLYQHPGAGYLLRNAQRLDGYAGLDVRGDGGYIVAPPSRHWAGTRYEWNLENEPVRPLPDWLLALLQRRRDSGEGERVDRAPGDATPAEAQASIRYWTDKAQPRAVEGARNATAFWWACQLRDDGVSQADAEGAADRFYDLLADTTGFALREVYNALRSAYRTAPRERARSKSLPFRAQSRVNGERTSPVPTRVAESTRAWDGLSDDETDDYEAAPENIDPEPPDDTYSAGDAHLTDLGNARRFTRRHGANVRYISAWGHWLIWDSSRWQQDRTDAVMRKAKETVAHIYAEAGASEDDQQRKDLARWAMRSEAESRLRAMLALSESEPGIAIAVEQLDRNGWLLNARNGLIDLRTGKLLPHDRDALCTKRAEADYDPAASCLAWDTFLDRIFAGDTGMIAYVQRAVGYALTADTGEQCVFVLYGSGANGKSTFEDTLGRILGDYAMTTPMETFQAKQGQTIPSDVARLMGARFVAASESADGRRLDEELIKRISGGDRMSARFMHKDWFEFYPVLKLFLAVNHKPTIRGTDNGIWRRIQLWPFEVTIPREEQDPDLKQKLLAEAPGILAWAVRGCLEWQRVGLSPPTRVLDATTEYRSEMDAIGRFVADRCLRTPNVTASAKALYEAYKAWCQENGEREQSQTRFGLYLRDQGLRKDKNAASLVIWRGIGLRETSGASG